MFHMDAKTVITALTPFFTEKRLARLETAARSRIESIEVASEAPANIHNALALIRTMEAFGLEQIHIVTDLIKKPSGQATSQGARRWVDINYYNTIPPFSASLKERGFMIAGAAPGSNMSLYDIPIDKPICVLFGNEHSGLSSSALAACDMTFTIPMHGMAQSLNLSVAGAIAIHDLTRRRREWEHEYLPKKTSPKDESRLADYMMRALGTHRAQRILEHLDL